MKRLVIFAMLILTAAAFAVPQYLTYQGVLRDNTGALVTGTKSMAFEIFNASTGGTAVFSSGTLSVPVSNGNYTTQLGPVNSTTIFNDTADKYLEVSVDGTALSPRLKINSVGYAIRAGVATAADTATTVSDLAVTTGKINNLAVTGAKIADGTIAETKLAPNILINTSGSITANTLVVTKITTQGAGCVGFGTIAAGNLNTPINNPNVTDNSIILINPTTRNGTHEALVPYGIVNGTSFNVAFSKTLLTYPFDISFNYLIIN